MIRKPAKVVTPLKIAQALFALNALIWLAFGVFRYFVWQKTHPGNETLEVIIPLMMIVNAAGMAFCSFAIGKLKIWLYFAAVGYLLVNIVLTITDQFGVYDLITLIIGGSSNQHLFALNGGL